MMAFAPARRSVATFQQYVVAPANYLTPIPKDLPSDLAAPMLCAGVAAYSALRKSRARSGDWKVMMGAGGGVRHAILLLSYCWPALTN